MGKQWKQWKTVSSWAPNSLQMVIAWNWKMLGPWKKSMTIINSILKSRYITLQIKFCLVKAMLFPVVMYGCDSWTIKKAERWGIDAIKLWCWRRLLRVPWTARSSQSTLKEISPEYSFEGLMLKLKLQYFGHLMQRTDSLENTLMPGKIEGRRRRGRQRMRWLDEATSSMDTSLSKLREWWWTGKPVVLQSMGSQRVGHDLVTELTENEYDSSFAIWQGQIQHLKCNLNSWA